MYIFRRISIQTTLIVAVFFAAQTHSETPLDERVTRLTELLEEQRKLYKIPGLAVAVVKDNQVILQRGFGVKSIKQNHPVTDNTLFAIGSTSKAFTATLLGMRIDDGVMYWDDAIINYLPQYQFKTHEKRLSLTLRDALSHRSGYARNDILWANGRVSRGEIIRAATKAKPVSENRAEFNYNNVMFLAAGMATAYDHEFDWDTLLQERLLTPLKMTDTTSDYAKAKKDRRLSNGYFWHDVDEKFYALPLRNLNNIAPAGGIYSNARDMAKWVSFLLNAGSVNHKTLIKAETLAATFSPAISVSDTNNYGLGWFISEYKGEPLLEHAGSIEGFAAQVAMLPDSNVGFALMMNVSTTPLQLSSINLIFDTLLNELVEPLSKSPDHNYAPYVGKYIANFEQHNNALFEFKMHGSRPAVDVPGQTLFMLKAPNEQAKMYLEVTDNVAFSFRKDEKNQVISMFMHEDGMEFELPKKGVTKQATAKKVSNGQVEKQLSTQDLFALMSVESQKQALEKLGMIEISGTLLEEQSGVSGRFTIQFFRNLYYRIYKEYGHFGHEEITIAPDGAAMKGLSHVMKLTGKYLEQTYQDHPINHLYWNEHYKSIAVSGVKKEKNEATITVVLEGFDAPDVTVLVDVASGQVKKQESIILDPVWGEMAKTVELSEYKNVKGLNIPFKIKIIDRDRGNVLFNLEKVKTNLDLDSSIFKMIPN